MFGRSPACGPPGASSPCLVMPGAKCSPAVMNIGAWYFPVVCTWIACVPGGAATRSALISTPLFVSRSVAVPTVFPIASLIVAEAVAAGACANAIPADRMNELQNANVFMRRSLFRTSKEIKPSRSFVVRKALWQEELPEREFDFEADQHGHRLTEARPRHEAELLRRFHGFLVETKNRV